MLSFSTLAKLAAGPKTMDALAEIASSVGLNVGRLTDGQKPVAFQQLARMAGLPGADVVIMRDGQGNMMSILVALPEKKVVEGGRSVVQSGGRALEAPGKP